jgi:inosine/xanthosine triphosphate pyrophosphatase family protein/ribosomal protein S18 acetylase RimI-like enzyme
MQSFRSLDALTHLEQISVEDNCGEPYTVMVLSRLLAAAVAPAIVNIHNDIPHVLWTEDDLLSMESVSGVKYENKFVLSFLLLDHKGDVAGVLIAYRRTRTRRHPFESVYIHRLAIRSDIRGRTLGQQLVQTAINAYFSNYPGLQTVTVQTNLEDSNRDVLRFYDSIGFRRWGPVHYPEKTDILFEISRAETPYLPWFGRSEIRFRGKGIVGDAGMPPVAFLASTSLVNKVQYSYLFQSHGIELRFVGSKLNFVEPQIDGADEYPEQQLVEFPLKNNARYLALSNKFPVVLDDTMLFIEHYNEGSPWLLPGPDTKRWWAALGLDGILRTMEGSRRRRAKYVCQLGVAYGDGVYETYRYELAGRISDTIGGDPYLSSHPFTDSHYFHKIFIPDGANRTLSEMEADEFFKYDYRRLCLEKAIPKIKAYSNTFDEALF